MLFCWDIRSELEDQLDHGSVHIVMTTTTLGLGSVVSVAVFYRVSIHLGIHFQG